MHGSAFTVSPLLFVFSVSLFVSYSFYAVVVARQMSPGCPADIGRMYPDPGAYSENSNAYITAAWSSTPPNNLSDDTVPAVLVIGENDRYTATKPGRTQITYQNVPLTPGVQYCFFILTTLTTSVPNVSLLYVRLRNLLFTFNCRYTKQNTLNLLYLPLVSKINVIPFYYVVYPSILHNNSDLLYSFKSLWLLFL